MTIYFIRVWKNHTTTENSNIVINPLPVKPNPENKKEHKRPLVGDFAYIYHLRYSNRARGDKENESGRGLYCYGRILEVIDEQNQISVVLSPEKNMNFKIFTCDQLKYTPHPLEIEKYMSDSCNEGINLVSEEADNFLQQQFNR